MLSAGFIVIERRHTVKPVLFALAVSLSIAGHPTATGNAGTGSSRQGSDDEDVFWTQLPTGIPMPSQYFTDMYPEYDCGVAEDFEFPTETSINRIRWWGGYWNTSEPFPIDAPVEIYLYLDDGTGNAPTLPQHSSAIASWMIPVGDYTEVQDADNFLCTYDFDESIVFNADTKYWFEIRKAYAFDPCGQYGWIVSEPGFLAPCVQGFDGLGIDWWTPGDTGAAFELIFDDALVLEASTWGRIKTIF